MVHSEDAGPRSAWLATACPATASQRLATNLSRLTGPWAHRQPLLCRRRGRVPLAPSAPWACQARDEQDQQHCTEREERVTDHAQPPQVVHQTRLQEFSASGMPVADLHRPPGLK
jgi:hypothetical protein